MVLVDREIRFLLERGALEITPLDPGQIQPSSIDLRLDRFARVVRVGESVLDLSDPELGAQYEEVEIPTQGTVLAPDSFMIAQVMEIMRLPDDCMGRIAQRSSLMRLGLQVSSSLINPGYTGQLPCLILNQTGRPVRIFAGMPFCQLILHRCVGRPERTYPERDNAKYHGERPARPSAIHADVLSWVKPAPRPLKPEQVAQLKVELLEGEGDGKLQR